MKNNIIIRYTKTQYGNKDGNTDDTIWENCNDNNNKNDNNNLFDIGQCQQ
jgi:hypothetical protein